jgi:ribosomal-protein-alanine N-acetyltransferase
MPQTHDSRRLTTERTVLRPLEESDSSVMHALWADPGVRKYLWDDVLISAEQAKEAISASRAHFDKHQFGLWAVCDRLTGDVIGFCGFRPADSRAPELLYGLWPRYWRQGLAHEAAAAALAYVFRVLGCREVVAATDVPNEVSARVLQRLGMQLERRGLLNGLDTLFYRLHRDDFESASRPDAGAAEPPARIRLDEVNTCEGGSLGRTHC